MIDNIQILRAFAALNVVLFHIIGSASSYSQGTILLNYLRGWGANGVDIFFGISGFVMLYTQMRKRQTPLAFFRSRVIRIVPIYWAVTFFIVALYLASPSAFREMVVTPAKVFFSLTFTSFVLDGSLPIVHVGWTLEWEMFFYLAIAMGLFFRSWWLLAAFVVVVLVAAAVTTRNWIVLEFLLGMGVACIHRHNIYSKNVGFAVLWLGIALLALSLLPAIRHLGVDRAIVWGIPAFFMVLGAVLSNQFKNRALSYLGNASYSIYLVQILAIPVFYKFSTRLLPDWNGDALALLCLIWCAATGCLVYSLVEKPMTVWLKHRVQIRGWRFVGHP